MHLFQFSRSIPTSQSPEIEQLFVAFRHKNYETRVCNPANLQGVFYQTFCVLGYLPTLRRVSKVQERENHRDLGYFAESVLKSSRRTFIDLLTHFHGANKLFRAVVEFNAQRIGVFEEYINIVYQ